MDGVPIAPILIVPNVPITPSSSGHLVAIVSSVYGGVKRKHLLDWIGTEIVEGSHRCYVVTLTRTEFT